MISTFRPLTCQDLFKKLAEATGETLDSVYQMHEAERNGLLEVLGLKREDEKGKLRNQQQFFLLGDGSFKWAYGDS